ncbi:MAG: hypothetical protein IT285_11425 [Bdellovibrionales bacterium]|nr:hypothetical protein [Bdellovibrionales bacterium]
MVRIEHLKQRLNLRPYLWVAVVWLIFGGLILRATAEGSAGAPVGWFGLFWGLSLMNLFLLLKVVASLLTFVSETDDSKRHSALKSLGIWSLSKLGGISLLVAALFQSQAASLGAVALGLGVFAVVPVVGGLWWSRQLSTVESPEYVC